MPGVPDTNTFSLQDVVDVVNPAVNSLRGCFNDAIDYYFQDAYKGSKDRLSNFRGYGNAVGKYFDLETANDGFIDESGINWNTVHGSLSGNNVDSVNDYEVYVDYSGSLYYIYRTFLSFDLSQIPAGSTCDKALLGLRTLDEYAGASEDYPVGCLGSQSSPLVVDDFDALTFADVAFDSFEDDDGTIFSSQGFNRQIRSYGSAQRALIAGKFGGTLDIAIINDIYDQSDNPPSSKYGVQIFRAGEFYAPPVLYIEFTI